MINSYKSISKWQKLCNFYNIIVSFLICDKESKFISRNALIVNRTNIQFTQNTMKFSISHLSIKVWDEKTLNFIIKLSKSQNFITDQHYNTILVMINHFTKYTYLISFCENYKAEQLKYVILNQLIRYHEILKGLTSDRNKLFTFKYWQIFILILKVRLRFFTIYHPQTDEQTKQINQTLKQYLYHYINYHQDNWVKLLLVTQIAINSRVLNTTKISSYFVNYDRKPNLFGQELHHVSANLTMNRIKKFKDIKNNI